MNPTTAPRVAFTTLGCKVNQSETDSLARQFAAAGYHCVPYDDCADVYVVNTCTVTHVADKKSRQMLSQARRSNPDALVVATGCYASIVKDALADPHTVVIRNRDKDRILELVEGRLRRTTVHLPQFIDTEKYEPTAANQARTRAMVKVQDGCDSHCTYCIIPRARGRSRSVAPATVVQRVRTLVEQGHAEVVITGVDLGSYGQDEPSFPDLGGLVQQLLLETDVARIRVSSLEPGDFTFGWLELWQDRRLCRHLHVPLQSGSATVLNRMERSYQPERFAEMVSRCRESIPGVTITTDLIVGFPGETEEEFAEGLGFIRQMAFDGMHVFRYSQRSGTRAARYPDQVPNDVKAERSRILRAEALAGLERLAARHVGQKASVVWESEQNSIWRGLTDTNVRTYGAPSHAHPGSLSRVTLGDRFGDGLWSEALVVDIPLLPVG